MTVQEITEKYGQRQLLQYWDSLSEEERQSLSEDIASVDFELMAALYRNAGVSPVVTEDLQLTPMPCADATAMTKEEKDRIRRKGMDVLLKGKMAALTMAGGQGSRLGHEGPKGTYDIGLPDHKSLFEIQCDGLKKISMEAGRVVPWYIMTSEINHKDTVAFFEEHNYFNYPKESIYFFPQTMIPVLDKEGKLLLASPSKVLRSPNGNGGLFQSLHRSGALDDMKRRGVEWLFICGIDNCLVQMADPLFMGYMLDAGKKVAAKSYIKRGPGEKAGIFCFRGGRPSVIEYTEIPQKYAEMKDENGIWVYGDTNVLNYIFRLDVIEKLATSAAMAYHTAVKKITRYADGQLVTSQEPDAYKFELFLFDCFSTLDDLGVLRIERIQEFAPVKNKTGEDSAELALQMFTERQAELKRLGEWKEYSDEAFSAMFDPQLKKAQQAMLEIVDEFDRVCRQNEIPYFLSGGSVLGAVRHGGFIPWDDDVDIGMCREAYEKFLTCADQLDDRFYLQCEDNDPDYPLVVPKIRMKNTRFVCADYAGNDHIGQELSIDLVIYDHVPNNAKMRKKHKKQLNLYDQAVCYKYGVKQHFNPVKDLIIRLTSLKSAKALKEKRRRLMRDAHLMNREPDRYISALLVVIYDKIMYPIDVIEEPVIRDDIIFEGRQLPVPAQAERFLEIQFGDYMRLPPPEKRVTHHVIEIEC